VNPLNPTLTPARHWKDIPQQVSHRAMSSEGRRRVVFGGLKTAGIVAALALLGWAGLEVASVFQDDPRKMPEAVKAAPMKDLVLVTDGVLDQAWLAHTLALPKGTSLMELDLFQLRSRLLASGQVRAATLTRSFPATLAVTLAERTPMARLQVQDKAGDPQTLFVARDGVVFEGVGFDPKMTGTLPWLAGVKLARQGGAFLPIAGMEPVAELIAKAKLEAEHLYVNWRVVSLARLESDGEIEIGTKDGTKIIFGVTEDFFRQLANLDAILDAARAQPDKALREINLAVGGQVPVSFDGLSPQMPPAKGAAAAELPAPAIKPLLFTGLSNH
jgi:cell division protein FtsQ